jgi:murein tripeptide amidase MpaA
MNKYLFVLSAMVLMAIQGLTQDSTLTTFYEKSGFRQTPRYKETMEFCKELARSSTMVNFTNFGESCQGRKLPLVIVDKEGLNDPEKIREHGRIVVLVQACIHAGECEGKDAGLMLVRDIILNRKYPGIMEHVSLLFIPIFNVDGHERFGPYNRINQNGPEEMGWRVTATNLNLNRDYLKADAPEMQYWLRMYNKWQPEFFIDTHTTDGADYQYVLTYYMNIYGGMEEGLTSWTKDVFLKSWISEMENAGIPVFPYIEFRSWHDPASGIENNVSPPMLSQGYTALHNRPGLLVETHMLKPYADRVSATYTCLVNCLRIVNKEYKNLQDAEANADHLYASAEFRKKDFPLRYTTVATDSSMVDFLGYRYTKVHSDITGEDYFQFGKEKTTFRIPYFEKNKPDVTVKLPEAYIIPVEWRNVIERLKLHGIKLIRLQHDTTLRLSVYRFSDPKWQVSSYEGRHVLNDFGLAESTEEITFSAGSVVIDMAQPAAGVAAQILEPKGNGSYVYWGFFDAVFEQKEYSENYVMEVMAKTMLSENPALKEEFERKKQENKAFASNPNAILNWFYSKTPYWDTKKNLYPVGRIMDRKTVDSFIRK